MKDATDRVPHAPQPTLCSGETLRQNKLLFLAYKEWRMNKPVWIVNILVVLKTFHVCLQNQMIFPNRNVRYSNISDDNFHNISQDLFFSKSER